MANGWKIGWMEENVHLLFFSPDSAGILLGPKLRDGEIKAIAGIASKKNNYDCCSFRLFKKNVIPKYAANAIKKNLK